MTPNKIKPGKIHLRSQKLPKVGTVSVIKGPGNLSAFELPLEPEEENSKLKSKPASKRSNTSGTSR
ncbi:MAG: hypothetical protein WCA91_10350 [Candidatus Acidiferrales bacterium]